MGWIKHKSIFHICSIWSCEDVGKYGLAQSEISALPQLANGDLFDRLPESCRQHGMFPLLPLHTCHRSQGYGGNIWKYSNFSGWLRAMLTFFTSSDLFCTTGRKTDTSSDGDHFLEHWGGSLHRWDDHQQFAHPRDQNLFLDLLRILAGLGLPLPHIQHLHPGRGRGPGLQQHRLRGGLAPVLLDRGQPGRDHARELLLDRCQLDEEGDEELQVGGQQPSPTRVHEMKRVWRVFWRDKMQKSHIYCEIDSAL